MSRGFIVTGTDTDIGKTVFAAGLAAALGATYWKPVQTGADTQKDSGADAATVEHLGVPKQRILDGIYCLPTPCSPHYAAELAGLTIDTGRLSLPQCDGSLIIEGAGGVLVPVTRKLLFADQFKTWNLPVILVARTGLGTINHSLLSIEALRARGIVIAGVAFIGDAAEDSEATIAQIGQVKRLGRLPVLPVLDRDTLAVAFASAFNLEDFA